MMHLDCCAPWSDIGGCIADLNMMIGSSAVKVLHFVAKDMKAVKKSLTARYLQFKPGLAVAGACLLNQQSQRHAASGVAAIDKQMPASC